MSEASGSRAALPPEGGGVSPEKQLPIGALVGVRGLPGLVGKVCGAMSTVMFPGGIYPVEHADANGDPKVSWWHAADLFLHPIN